MRRASSAVTSFGVVSLTDFVLSHLPPTPAAVLEVGCGQGELALAVAAAGYDVVAVDPGAPAGAIFRRVRLEELEPGARFDAVVASRSFHHMSALDDNLARVAEMLAGGGPFILDEFGWDRLDDDTAAWYEGQRRVLLAAGAEPEGPAAAEWKNHHAGFGVHGFDALLEAVERRFEARSYEETPYLWRYLGGATSLALEETLIATGTIRPLGFRFVGIPKRASALGT